MSVISACPVASGPIPQAAWVSDPDGKPSAAADATSVALPPASPASRRRPLHRLGEVRRREGLPRVKIARRLGISVKDEEKQEEPSTDMLLSEFLRWQAALGVPAAELLHEPEADLSPPVQLRARLLRVMKTVRSIQEEARQASIQRLAQVMIDQLLEVMPELKETVAWPAVGHRRKLRELGQAFFRGFSVEFLNDMERSER